MLIASYKKDSKKNKSAAKYDSKRKYINVPLIICVICTVLSMVGYIISSNYAINASNDLAEMSRICEDTYKDANDAEYLTKLCTEIQLNKIEDHYLNEKNTFRNIAFTALAMVVILVILSIVSLNTTKSKE